MPTRDSQLREVITAETNAVLRTVTGLSDAELAAGSGVGDWSRRELAAHIAGSGASYASWIARARAGKSDPPPDRGFVRGAGASAAIAARARDAAEATPDVAAAIRDTAAGLDAQLGALAEADFDRPVFHPSGVTEVRRLAQFRVAELALHHWDMLSGLGREAGLGEGAIDVLLDWTPCWLGLCFRPAEALYSPYSYSFDVPGREPLRAVVYGDRAEIGRPGPSIVTFISDAETHILVVTGRLGIDEAEGAGRLTVVGQPDVARTFGGWFPPL